MAPTNINILRVDAPTVGRIRPQELRTSQQPHTEDLREAQLETQQVSLEQASIHSLLALARGLLFSRANLLDR